MGKNISGHVSITCIYPTQTYNTLEAVTKSMYLAYKFDILSMSGYNRL